MAGAGERAAEAAAWLGMHLRVEDVDARVHVFEVTIRALGEQPAWPSAGVSAHGCPFKAISLWSMIAAGYGWSAAVPHACAVLLAHAGALHAWSPVRLRNNAPCLPPRAGGLLAAHVLLLRAPAQEPAYAGGLLPLAARLADALLPAFDTPSGIPLSWVNLVQVRSGPSRMGLQAARRLLPWKTGA